MAFAIGSFSLHLPAPKEVSSGNRPRGSSDLADGRKSGMCYCTVINVQVSDIFRLFNGREGVKYYVSLPYRLSINQAIEAKIWDALFMEKRNNVGKIPESTKSKREMPVFAQQKIGLIIPEMWKKEICFLGNDLVMAEARVRLGQGANRRQFLALFSRRDVFISCPTLFTSDSSDFSVKLRVRIV